jgi:hypothetical protein
MTLAAKAATPSHRAGRHRRDTSRPSGNTSGRNTAAGVSQKYHPASEIHPDNPSAGADAERRFVSASAPKLTKTPMTSRIQPTALRGWREATTAPTSG